MHVASAFANLRQYGEPDAVGGKIASIQKLVRIEECLCAGQVAQVADQRGSRFLDERAMDFVRELSLLRQLSQNHRRPMRGSVAMPR